jgi:hypothetical protein
MEVVMDASKGWQVTCDRRTFEKCQADERFAYIVALARSTNALNAVHSFLMLVGKEPIPKASRDRLNSYFFASAILYEMLKLIRRMNKVFLDDEMFQVHLRTILKDPVATKIEQDHLKHVRHEAVFHFDPESFAETISKATVNECVFIESLGQLQGDINYSFADVVAAEILAGVAQDTEEFYSVLEDTMANTRALVVTFIPAAEKFIRHHLRQWGFTLRPASYLPQSQ